MRILHVITSLSKAAGTTTFVENVTREMQFLGHVADISVSERGFVLCDIMHIHGLWSGLLHKAVKFAWRNHIPIVWSTHGMTAPWSMRHKWWKKVPAWLLYQKRDLMRADAIHCTTEQEAVWNKQLGFKKCVVVPLGTGESLTDELPLVRERKVLLFVGRIYPVKGLENLICAWRMALDSDPTERERVGRLRWILRIVGPDQAGYRKKLEQLVSKLNLRNAVEFAGPKYGRFLSQEYQQSECLVLPSFTENFGGVVIDALANGKPCIASTFTPWQELQNHGCGWWVDNSPEELSGAISSMMAMSEAERRRMGESGRALVKEKYSWPAVVADLLHHYEDVIKNVRNNLADCSQCFKAQNHI